MNQKWPFHFQNKLRNHCKVSNLKIRLTKVEWYEDDVQQIYFWKIVDWNNFVMIWLH